MITEYVGSIASLIGSLTVVGGALLWIYNKFIGDPRERRRTKEETQRQLSMLKMIQKENDPLNKSIQQLTEWLNESKADREALNRISQLNSEHIADHDDMLDVLTDRVIILETVNKYARKLEKQGSE